MSPEPALPFLGERDADVLHVAPVSIHGDLYYDLTIQLIPVPVDARGEATRIRIPAHTCPSPPTAGDRVRISFLMGQAQSVRILSR